MIIVTCLIKEIGQKHYKKYSVPFLWYRTLDEYILQDIDSIFRNKSVKSHITLSCIEGKRVYTRVAICKETNKIYKVIANDVKKHQKEI